MQDTLEDPVEAYVDPRISGRESFDGFDRYAITADRDSAPELRAEVEKLNKMVKRHGGVVRIVSEEEINKVHPFLKAFDRRGNRLFGDDGKQLPVIIRQTIFTIEAPAMAGEKAKLVGSFELAEDGVSVYTKGVPGTNEAVLALFKDRWQECEHCGYDRRRHASFVCERTDGSHIIIGRNCSKAYLGLSPADLLARVAVAYQIEGGDRGDDEEGSFSFGGVKMIYLEGLVARAYRVAQHLGGYSRMIKDRFMLHMSALNGAKDFGRDTTMRDIRREYEGKYLEPLDFYAFADYIGMATGDFGENLRIAFSCEYVKDRRVGLVIAGVGIFVGRALKLVEELKAAKHRPEAKLLDGKEGDRVDFEAEIVKTIPFDNNFGGGIMVIMTATDGSNVIHYATGDKTPDAGDRCMVRGTIKKHGTARHDGRPQTVVARATYKAIETK